MKERRYKVTVVLRGDDYDFVQRISKLLRCSISHALVLCVVWSRNSRQFTDFLKTVGEGCDYDSVGGIEQDKENEEVESKGLELVQSH